MNTDENVPLAVAQWACNWWQERGCGRPTGHDGPHGPYDATEWAQWLAERPHP